MEKKLKTAIQWAVVLACMPILFLLLLVLAILNPFRLGQSMEKTGKNLQRMFSHLKP